MTIGVELLLYEYCYFCFSRYSYTDAVYKIGEISHKIVCGVKLSSEFPVMDLAAWEHSLEVKCMVNIYPMSRKMRSWKDDVANSFLFLICNVNKEKNMYTCKPEDPCIVVYLFFAPLKLLKVFFFLKCIIFSQSCINK